MRHLAQRSAQAAKETAGKIEGAISRTGQGVDISRKVSATLNEIVAKARQVDELVTGLAGSSHEQAQGFTLINGAILQMDKVMQSNAAYAGESAAAAGELTAQAENMEAAVLTLLRLVEGNRAVVEAGRRAPDERAVAAGPGGRNPRNRSLLVRSNGPGPVAPRLNSWGKEVEENLATVKTSFNS